MDWTTKDRILVTAPRGAGDVLAEELRALGYHPERVDEASVDLTGSLRDCLKLNLHLFCAHRVLYRVGAFACDTADAFYRAVRQLPWEDVLPEDGYFTVGAWARTPCIRDNRYLGLRCKDAVADRIRDRCGRRPDSGSARHGAAIWVHWAERECRVYLDTSGESLSRRGYRKIPLEAPMQEVLAAVCLRLAGWTPERPLVNPMCGSGTVAVEAALWAAGTAPGSLRPFHAFMALRGYRASEWGDLVRAVRPRAVPSRPGITATDLRPEAEAATRVHAERAGVAGWLHTATCDFADTPVPPETALWFFNPEYGKRMGEEAALGPVYRRIGTFLKTACSGHTAAVLTGSPKLARQIGLRPRNRHDLYNGPLACRLALFDLF